MEIPTPPVKHWCTCSRVTDMLIIWQEVELQKLLTRQTIVHQEWTRTRNLKLLAARVNQWLSASERGHAASSASSAALAKTPKEWSKINGGKKSYNVVNFSPWVLWACWALYVNIFSTFMARCYQDCITSRVGAKCKGNVVSSVSGTWTGLINMKHTLKRIYWSSLAPRSASPPSNRHSPLNSGAFPNRLPKGFVAGFVCNAVCLPIKLCEEHLC